MSTGSMPDVALPDEAKAAVWRIFGKGESPLTGRSTFDLIEGLISKHVPSSTNRDRAISVIRGWFETSGDRRWLKPDVREPVAELILGGTGAEWSETAIWAVGSIDRDLAARMIRSRWFSEDIDSFVDAAITTLERVCSSDKVLSAAGVFGLAEADSGSATIPRDDLRREGKLGTFRHILRWRFELIHRALHRTVGNLIEVVLDLRPEMFQSLVARLDHPVMQARAADYLVVARGALDHRKPLSWVTENSCDELIALAILHTLETINRLDEDIQASSRMGEDRTPSGTELRPHRMTPKPLLATSSMASSIGSPRLIHSRMRDGPASC